MKNTRILFLCILLAVCLAAPHALAVCQTCVDGQTENDEDCWVVDDGEQKCMETAPFHVAPDHEWDHGP